MEGERPSPSDRSDDLVAREVARETLRWRERVLDGLGWTAVVGAAAAVGLSALQGFTRRSTLVTAAFGLGILVVAVGRRGRFAVRLALLLGGIYGIVATTLLTGRIAANATAALTITTLLATILAGKRWGLVCVAFGTLAVLSSGLALRLGLVVQDADWYAALDPSRPGIVVRISIVFAAVTSLGVLATGYLVTRTEAALLERARSLAALEREVAEKERMRREIDEREATFRRARELELLGRLAGFAAHDFNNALLVIQAHCDLARDAESDAELRASLDSIATAARQAAATSKQLRAFSPGRSGEVRRVKVADQVQRACGMLSRILPANVSVEVELQGDATVRIDEGVFQGVLTNLALNARDAMPQGGTLRLRVREPNEAERASAGERRSIAVDVEDTGHGMDAATLARAFEPFFTTKGAIGGGLGLASVRETVLAHGGKVDVRSEVGVGTVFSLLWPIDDRADDEEPARRPVPRTGSVLFVEDAEPVRSSLARVLTSAGFSVAQAPNVDEAVLILRRARRPFDLLLTDCILPGRPVSELVAEYRAAAPAGRVLVCSGYSPTEVLPPELPIDAFLPKPFATDVLVSTLHGLMPAA